MPFCILFVAAWAGVILFMLNAISMGGNIQRLCLVKCLLVFHHFFLRDFLRVLYGTDYNGLMCGQDAAVKSQAYTAFPALAIAPNVRICVADCNSTMSDSRFVVGNNYASTQCNFALSPFPPSPDTWVAIIIFPSSSLLRPAVLPADRGPGLWSGGFVELGLYVGVKHGQSRRRRSVRHSSTYSLMFFF